MKRIISILLSALIVLSISAFLFGCSSSDSSNDNLDYAKTKVEDYVNSQARYNAEFYDEIYAKGYLAAQCFTPKKTDTEQLKTVARYLYADAITITDMDGKIIAAYPDDELGKNIADIKDKVKYRGILKWIYPRCASDIVKDKDSGEYAVSVGVQRTDTQGCVIVDMHTEAYAKVDGSDLAEKCGPNIIVAKDKKVISTTMYGWEVGDELEDSGISDSDIKAGSFTIGEEKTNCSAATVDNYTVIYGTK